MYTKLEAVNEILDAISESSVSSLDADVPEAADAERMLDQYSKKIQAVGWQANTSYNVELVPDIDDRIPVPDNTLRIDTVGRSKTIPVVVRTIGGRKYLYRPDERTFSFTSPVFVDYVTYLPFEELTPELQMYVTARAARVHQRSVLSSRARDVELKEKEDDARMQAEQAEEESLDLNVLRDSQFMQRATYRRSRFFGRY